MSNVWVHVRKIELGIVFFEATIIESNHYRNKVSISGSISCKDAACFYMLYMDLWKRFVTGLDHVQSQFLITS